MRKKWKQKLGILLLGVLCSIPAISAQAGTIYDSEYVTVTETPSGSKIFTSDVGRDNSIWYPEYEDDPEEGRVVVNGVGTYTEPGTGQHEYPFQRYGNIPISEWRVVYSDHRCIHDNADTHFYHTLFYGTDYVKNLCRTALLSGWDPICADCGGSVGGFNFYMSKETVSTLDYLDVGTRTKETGYYYICPESNNLEQGVPLTHYCKAVSWNKYYVSYMKNGAVGGSMAATTHMYNNATEYEGQEITPDTHLRKNAYVRPGWEFAGWNTRPDGTGEFFSDEQEVLNLTSVNEGRIRLYAQWQRTTSTLEIDPAGGTYQGRADITSVTQDYNTFCQPSYYSIVPPAGATVTFDSMGGNYVAPITGTQTFKEWSITFGHGNQGQWDAANSKYTFLGPQGNIDRLTANYIRNKIILPTPYRENASFAGWYTDAACTEGNCVGNGGDPYTPMYNITLYAKWVTLHLDAVNNYTANNYKGAVNLNWLQPDMYQKTYIVKQRVEGGSWTQLTSSTEANNSPAVSQSFSYSGQAGTYTVPYTGLYTLTAAGAQGGSYDVYSGGLGGSTSGNFWLTAGEVLTYNIGGQDGYNGGGAATMYAGGGGCTIVTSNLQGTLLIAGGGGGATSQGNGGAGGSSTSNVASGNAGESGEAGGGGGCLGGKKGEVIVHNHDTSCYHTDYLDYTAYRDTDDDDYTDSAFPPADAGAWLEGHGYMAAGTSNGINVTAISRGSYTCIYPEHDEHPAGVIGKISTGNVAVRGNTSVTVHLWMDSWNGYNSGQVDNIDFDGHWENPRFYPGNYENNFVQVTATVTAQNGTQSTVTLYHKTLADLQGVYGDRINGNVTGYLQGDGRNTVVFNETLSLPEGTTSVKVYSSIYPEPNASHFGINLTGLEFTGGTNSYRVCTYADKEDGFIISSNPGYGGSNYINTAVSSTYTDQAGTQAGNGSFTISGQLLGFQMANRLDDVAAPDLAAPNTPAIREQLEEVVPGTRVRASWYVPEEDTPVAGNGTRGDNGTKYYHQVFSYLVQNGTVSDTGLYSNVTENTLVTGVKGYYYYLSYIQGYRPAEEWSYLDKSQPWVDINLQSATQYLYVAAVDVAGNVSGFAVREIPPAEEVEVDWSIATGPVTIEEGENVYRNPGSGTYYVRADGETPFLMRFSGAVQGNATARYQIDRLSLQIENSGVQRVDVTIPKEPAAGAGSFLYTGLEKSITEPEYLMDAAYTKAERSADRRYVTLQQKFTVDAAQNGQTFLNVPRAAVNGVRESLEDNDRLNALAFIADGEAPVITGTEILNDLDIIDRDAGDVVLSLQASDALSGLRELKVYVQNTDNYCERTYTADASGQLTINITQEDYLFNGDFTVTITATDNVGNVREEGHNTTEFTLQASLERILPPHDPVFQCGESGVLHIVTTGYADKVEVIFPDELLALNPELNKTYVYALPDYIQTENLEFMVPLYTPEGSYSILVNAYKNGRVLHEHPRMSTLGIGGTVLDDFRTRLR